MVEYKIAKVYIREQIGLKCVRNKNILVIAKLNLCETVLKQKNAKHNSRENKLVYSIIDSIYNSKT